MSYATTAALQAAVYSALQGDAALTALVGDAVYDAMPPGPVPALYVTLGPERVRDRSDGTAGGALHDFAITVVSDEAGFQGAKEAAAAVSDALVDAELALSRGTLVSLNFLRARARRVGQGREIEIWFRARVDDGVVV